MPRAITQRSRMKGRTGPATPSRLGRKRFGDEGYAVEELVAELGSAFLCADLKLTPSFAKTTPTKSVPGWKNGELAIFPVITSNPYCEGAPGLRSHAGIVDDLLHIISCRYRVSSQARTLVWRLHGGGLLALDRMPTVASAATADSRRKLAYHDWH